MSKRRSIKHDPGADTEITVKRVKGKRSREWDKAHNPGVATYRIGDELKQEIRKLAAELEISTAVIVKAFLAHGLDEHKAGNIDVYDKS